MSNTTSDHYLAKFAQKGQLKFRYGKNKGSLNRLPFWGRLSDKANYERRAWSTPSSGGYGGGNMTGKAAAIMYLKFLRGDGGDFNGGSLQNIAIGMAEALRAAHESGCEDAIHSIRGQIVGFFHAIERWTRTATRCLGSNLDATDDDELLRLFNLGISIDDAAYMASLQALDDAEEARVAAASTDQKFQAFLAASSGETPANSRKRKQRAAKE